jgi:hypothetical protein
VTASALNWKIVWRNQEVSLLMYLVGVLNFALISKLMFSPAFLCAKYCSTGGDQVVQKVGYDQSKQRQVEQRGPFGETMW